MLTRIIKYTTLIICASLILFFVLASLFHSMYLFSNWGICPIVSFTIIYLSSASLSSINLSLRMPPLLLPWYLNFLPPFSSLLFASFLSVFLTPTLSFMLSTNGNRCLPYFFPTKNCCFRTWWKLCLSVEMTDNYQTLYLHVLKWSWTSQNYFRAVHCPFNQDATYVGLLNCLAFCRVERFLNFDVFNYVLISMLPFLDVENLALMLLFEEVSSISILIPERNLLLHWWLLIVLQPTSSDG